MFISKKYALKLIKQGKAECIGIATSIDDTEYWIINRFDIHRTDHVIVDDADVDILGEYKNGNQK